MKLSDAFFITKYALKFNIDSQNAYWFSNFLTVFLLHNIKR